MANKKGAKKVGGRQKGTCNKFSKDVRQMVLNALNGAHPEGGEAWLKKQAEDNPIAFLQIVGKIIPAEIKASVKEKITVEIVKFSQ